MTHLSYRHNSKIFEQTRLSETSLDSVFSDFNSKNMCKVIFWGQMSDQAKQPSRLTCRLPLKFTELLNVWIRMDSQFKRKPKRRRERVLVNRILKREEILKRKKELDSLLTPLNWVISFCQCSYRYEAKYFLPCLPHVWFLCFTYVLHYVSRPNKFVNKVCEWRRDEE